MENIKLITHVIFIITTIISVALFYYACNKNKTSLTIVLVWLTIQAVLGVAGFYENSLTKPPRIVFMLAPTILSMIYLFNTKQGLLFIDSINLKYLTLMHSVRVLVEIVLIQLFVAKAIPEVMTFEGRNFDILSGLSAMAVFYFGYIKKVLSPKLILIWNVICLMLVINVVVYGILSAPSVVQQLNFNQPNIAVLHFPFVWLASFIVPVVIFAHLVAIRRLIVTSS